MAKKRKKPLKGGFFVAAAVLCEKDLEDADHVVSLIRIVDKVIVKGRIPLEPGVPKGWAQLAAFIALKSESDRKVSIKIALRYPSGKRTINTGSALSLELKGGWSGGAARCHLNFPIEEQGLHWFHVLMDEKRVARMPLFVEYQQVPPEELMPQQEVKEVKAVRKRT